MFLISTVVSGRVSDRNGTYTGLSTIFGGEEARFDGVFEELIDVTAVTRTWLAQRGKPKYFADMSAPTATKGRYTTVPT